MKKTIKIIDLLVKIANGEEVPKKIIFHGFEYWYEENMEDYKNAQTEYSDYIIGAKFHRTNWLNDEVEIIEEDKKIERLITLSGYDSSSMQRHYEKINEVCNKINEIIDAINELKKGE